MDTVEMASVSGGKDSTAMWIHALETNTANLLPVFADTGHEHELTYEYLDYLETKLGPIRRVKADFTARIEGKRRYVKEKWPEKLTRDADGEWLAISDTEQTGPMPDWIPDQPFTIHEGWGWKPPAKGMSDEEAAHVIERALSALYPTGNPFLDLCIWKGRFPSTKARFCTQFLKVEVIEEQVTMPLLAAGHNIVSWQGVRANESLARANLPMWEGEGAFRIYRPLIHWTVEEVFAAHKRAGIEPNPLYKLGMTRVGCMPCINCNKSELFEISRRFPDVVDRVREWEEIVKSASKRQGATFFPTAHGQGTGIDEWVEWSKTSRGGQQYDLFKAIDYEEAPSCSSVYGLCE